jgi:hypothetical protein
MSQRQALCFMNGNIVEGLNGVSYDLQPIDGIMIPSNCMYEMLTAKLCKRFRIDILQYML